METRDWSYQMAISPMTPHRCFISSVISFLSCIMPSQGSYACKDRYPLQLSPSFQRGYPHSSETMSCTIEYLIPSSRHRIVFVSIPKCVRSGHIVQLCLVESSLQKKGIFSFMGPKNMAESFQMVIRPESVLISNGFRDRKRIIVKEIRVLAILNRSPGIDYLQILCYSLAILIQDDYKISVISQRISSIKH